jgi:hypothetical protein
MYALLPKAAATSADWRGSKEQHPPYVSLCGFPRIIADYQPFVESCGCPIAHQEDRNSEKWRLIRKSVISLPVAKLDSFVPLPYQYRVAVP